MSLKRRIKIVFAWSHYPHRNVILFVAVFSILSGTTLVAATPTDEDARAKQEAAIELATVWQLQSTNEAIALFRASAQEWELLAKPRNAIVCLDEAVKLTQTSDYELTVELMKDAIAIATKNGLRDEKII